MTQLSLVRLSQLSSDDLYERGDAVYDPTGDTATGTVLVASLRADTKRK